MRAITFRNGWSSLLGLTEMLAIHGQTVAPRGMETLEMRNIMIRISHPDDVLMTGIGRNWSSQLAGSEALQLIGGFSDSVALCQIAPNMKNFVNEITGEFDGAYGPRVYPQMQPLLDRLMDDNDTRQGVLQIWDYGTDQLRGSKDYPCTVYINFSIRDRVLYMTTHMRSNDVWWGWSYDLFQFTQFGWTVANYLGLEMGPYTHVADSFHLYARDFSAVQKLHPPASAHPRLRGIGLRQDGVEKIHNWREFAQQPAWEFFNDPINTPVTDSEAWFNDLGLWIYTTTDSTDVE